MRDYAETVQAMRYAFEQPCYDCVLGEKCNWGDFCFFKSAADAIEELLDELTTIRKQLPHWISVEERLPEVDERVLACVGIPGELSVWDGVRWNGEEWESEEEAAYDYWKTIDDPVTHWMPLPLPPKGVE